jgi:choline dehydrogenase-like flavoprotein
MITDARSIPANAELKCDLCIVGAGAAGITLALQFVESKLRVIVLESGGEKLEAEQQALYHGEVVDGVHSPAHLYRQRRLGGSTTIWGGRCVPLDEQDFWKRPHSCWRDCRRRLWRRQEGGMTVHHAASNAHHEASDPRACTEADRVIAAFVFAKVATEDRSDGLALS